MTRGATATIVFTDLFGSTGLLSRLGKGERRVALLGGQGSARPASPPSRPPECTPTGRGPGNTSRARSLLHQAFSRAVDFRLANIEHSTGTLLDELAERT
jgi:hypothetical protein